MNVQLNFEERVARITLCNPPSNIITFEMMDNLLDTVSKAADSPVVVFDSALEHFSTGVDIKIHTPEFVPEMIKRFHQVIRLIYGFPGITVSLVNGYALGGGLELALVCDLIFMDRDAKVAFPEIKLACFPPVAAVLLPGEIGRRANSLLYLGESINAAQASECGIADKLYAGKQMGEELIDGLKTSSYHALLSLKKTVRSTAQTDFPKLLDRAEKIYLEELLKSTDVAEGVNAFLEKRRPRFNHQV